jgi:hypothetical protein
MVLGLGRSKKMNPLFDGLKAAAEASIFGESIVCSGITLDIPKTSVKIRSLSVAICG